MGKEHRGFASMDPARRREIARMGGKAAHKKGSAHEWDRVEGRAAGEKSGANRRKRLLDRLAAEGS